MSNLTISRYPKAEEAARRLGRPVFGAGIDPVPAAVKGGKARQLNRRLKNQRELEARIAATKNGAAIFGLYRTQLERDQEINRERLRLDRHVMELDMLADGLRATIKDLDREVDERRLEVATLEQRRQAMALAVEGDDALITLLRDVGELRVQAACVACGWLDGEDDDVVA